MADMQQVGSTSRLYTPALPPTSKRARAKDKLQSAKRDAQNGTLLGSRSNSRRGKVSDEWRRSLVEDDTGELHDPEYTHFRQAAPPPRRRARATSSRSSSVSSISSIEGGLTNAYTEVPRSYGGASSMRLPGLPNVTTGVLPSSPLAARGGRYAGIEPSTSVYTSSRTSRTYGAEASSLYPGTIAADSSYNPYTYKIPKYDRDAFTPPPPIREHPGRARSLTPSEPSELAFESAYIPSLNQPTRHRSRPMGGAAREEQDAMEAGCYGFKRAWQATKLDFRFAILRMQRRSGMR